MQIVIGVRRAFAVVSSGHHIRDILTLGISDSPDNSTSRRLVFRVSVLHIKHPRRSDWLKIAPADVGVRRFAANAVMQSRISDGCSALRFSRVRIFAFMSGRTKSRRYGQGEWKRANGANRAPFRTVRQLPNCPFSKRNTIPVSLLLSWPWLRLVSVFGHFLRRGAIGGQQRLF